MVKKRQVVYKTPTRAIGYFKQMNKEQLESFREKKIEELHFTNENIKKVRNNRNEADMIENDDRLLTTNGFRDCPMHVDLYPNYV